jgi:hypothetical protein
MVLETKHSNMSWDPRDYDGVTYESERRERDELRELLAREAEEETAREMAFRDTPHCESACYETMIHTAACSAAAQPVTVAIGGWLAAVAPRMTAPRYAAIGNGLFVRVGTGRKRRAA